MVAEVFAGIGALKTAFDMTQGLQKIHDAVARDRAVIELQQEILAAQAAQSALVQSVSDLEKEVARLKDWESDKSRYQLAELRSGLVALSLKQSLQNGEPHHYICADCAANGKKSYLQKHISGPYYDEFRCGGCKSTIGVDNGTPPSRPDDYEEDFISVRR
jgi:hypothetical protein